MQLIVASSWSHLYLLHFNSPSPATSNREWVQHRTDVYKQILHAVTQDCSISIESTVKGKHICCTCTQQYGGGGELRYSSTYSSASNFSLYIPL